ncbi:4-amino-4-deoxychorismate lyase [Candidatus Nitrosoglobus terrae]|uniref:Aminodeoxychorismate lyase n=1 Tax=Candidatus Nitrosoglobus terrae TaxID=1630141 RepID=A0A1Q2SMR7_9GAMM|nr:aminodeoxychorismate lyase [Candidatus Nitrosoglobus terrae]BAW80412.1 4-amino-4-deoxychorismate lyase [Candidatus Nitrosoglobus terrae]
MALPLIPLKVLVNGQISHKISIADRGLQYGDGLFETIAIYKESPILYELHLKRLEAGCYRLSLPLPKRETLNKEITTLCQGISRGVLKIIVTRGVSDRGYQPQPQSQSTRILSIHPWPDYPTISSEYGIRLRVCNTPLGRNSYLAGIKHLNRLEQVLARNEWIDPGISEGLMLDSQNNIISGTMSNLFIAKNGDLQTPDLSYCGVAGVMRKFILNQALALGIMAKIQPLTLVDITRAEEIFICNSLIGLWPVRSLNNIQYPLGSLTQRLRNLISAQLFCR